jgi:hypothetical protein
MPERYRELLARPTVDVRDPLQVELWTRALDVYTADLVEAVSVVGNVSAAVLEYLRDRGAARRPG